MTDYVVGRANEIPPGARKIVEVGGRSIGVFNVEGRFYALRNSCPHQGAPLCLGSIQGTYEESSPGEYLWGREGRILRCPWHGWEFDLTTGRSVFNPHRTRVRSYRVTVGSVVENGSSSGAEDELSDDPEDPSVETYPVTLDDGVVVLHV
jgi:3-phenylpropionate/trans-cinnamate dioxygenase ferredoxin subunit